MNHKKGADSAEEVGEQLPQDLKKRRLKKRRGSIQAV